ncbi:hypothetical protein [Rhodopseudomonas palustris]|uniref:hypothetical protein n=1 Tax=Rhodopseudomonas palustris TaxID=1076 RepID=UPI001A9E2F81|nr:hypothetical protein [Rhodopseudomonas palustris]
MITLRGLPMHTARLFGLVGQFWRPNFGLARIADGAAFAAFQRGGFVKLALNFATAPESDGRIRLTTETRAFCPDRGAHLKLLPYWYAVRPFSGLIRRRILAGLRRRSEAAGSQPLTWQQHRCPHQQD